MFVFNRRDAPDRRAVNVTRQSTRIVTVLNLLDRGSNYRKSTLGAHDET